MRWIQLTFRVGVTVRGIGQRRWFCALSLLLLSSAAGQTSPVLLDNGPPDKSHAWEMTGWVEADDFTLSAPARLDGVKFWQVDINRGFTGSLIWRIYSDKGGGGGPAELVYSGVSTDLVHQATGDFVFGGYPEYVTTVNLPPLSLPAGTYWLALHNGPLSRDRPWDCFWETTGKRSGSPSHALSSPFTGGWKSNVYQGYPPDVAFQLTGSWAAGLESFTLAPDAPTIRFTASEGQSYRVEYKDDLRQLSWSALPGAELVSGEKNAVEVRDPAAFTDKRPQRFYQVVLAYTGPVPQIQSLDESGRGPRISFSSTSGYLYRIEYRNGLADYAWKSLVGAEVITGTGGVMQVIDTDAQKSKSPLRLYRVSLL